MTPHRPGWSRDAAVGRAAGVVGVCVCMGGGGGVEAWDAQICDNRLMRADGKNDNKDDALRYPC